ncbi:MAG: putative transcriptional regulator [Chitinophagaceae bacterium]|nr:putative transcriptional regulator [Chitinophagaceae bacterium]
MNELQALIDEIKFRSKPKLTQEQIADRLGYDRSYLSQALRTGGSKKLINAVKKEFAKELDNITSDVPEQSYLEKRRHQKNNQQPHPIPVFESAPLTMGDVTQYRDEKQLEPDFWITIPQLKDCDYATRAKGASMAPMIRSGSLVIGKQLFDKSVIVYGEIYIVHTKNGLETIKYINAHPEKEDHLMLEPYNPKAGKTPIRKDEILKIFEYRACFQFP